MKSILLELWCEVTIARMPKLLMMVTVLAGCTFSLDEKYIDPTKATPEPIQATVDILSPTFEDPYFLSQPTYFTLKVQEESKLTRRQILSLAVTIDGAGVPHNIKGQILTFFLDPVTVGTGTHKVTIDVRLETGSGSLADQAGVEYFQLVRTFTLNVDLQPPIVTSALTAVIANGYLDLRWGLSKDNPYNYVLEKRKIESSGQENYLPAKYFRTEGQSAHFIDSGFVGGKVRYRLYLNSPANSQLVFLGDLLFARSPADFSLGLNADSVAILSWNPRFSNTFMTLTRSSGSQEFLFNPGSADLDTIFLGDKRTYTLSIRRNDYPQQSFDTTFSLQRNPRLPPFLKIAFLPSSRLLLLRQDGVIARHAIPSFTEESEFQSNNRLSQLVTNSLGSPLVSGAYLFPDPLQFGSYRYFSANINYPPGTWSGAEVIEQSSMSDNQLIGMSLRVNGSPRAAIADLTVDTDVQRNVPILWMDSVNFDLPELAPDGQYFCVNQMDQSAAYVYTRSGSSFVRHGKVPAGARHFRGPGSTELIVITVTSIQVVDVSASPGSENFFPPVRSFNLPPVPVTETIGSIGYDQQTQLLWVQSSDLYFYSTIRTYAITDLSLNEKAKAYNPPNYIPARHVYANHHHFLTSGFVARVHP